MRDFLRQQRCKCNTVDLPVSNTIGANEFKMRVQREAFTKLTLDACEKNCSHVHYKISFELDYNFTSGGLRTKNQSINIK